MDFKGKQSFSWRHFYCVTDKVWSNVKATFESGAELDGFEDLREEDQAKVEAAFEAGASASSFLPRRDTNADCFVVASRRSPRGGDSRTTQESEG